MIKIKTPINRTPAKFEVVDLIDIRFKKNSDSVWKSVIKYGLLSDSGELEGYHEKVATVEKGEIKKLETLIIKLIDGKKG